MKRRCNSVVHLAVVAAVVVVGCGSPPAVSPPVNTTAIEALKAKTHLLFGSLSKFTADGFSDPHCPRIAYRLSDLAELTQASIRGLVETLPVNAVPLRAYVRSFHPVLSAGDVPFNCFKLSDMVSSERADKFLPQVDNLYNKIGTLPGKRISLAVQSTPDEGRYVFSCPGDKESNVSDSKVLLWRGLCDFTMERIGFKSIEIKDINLVESTPSKFSCFLKDITGKDDSFCRIEY